MFPVAGTYTVTLTVSDAWGRAGAPVTREVTTSPEPAGNDGPDRDVPAAGLHGTVVCGQQHRDDRPARASGATRGTGATGPRRAPAPSPSAHLYAAAGTYTITLTVTDNWGRTTTATRDVTVA